MITRLISSEHRPQQIQNLDIKQILDNDQVSVHVSAESSSHAITRDHSILTQVPTDRCYRPGFVRSETWMPRNPDFSLQLMHPVAWVKNKNTNTVYELLGIGGYVGGHGHFNNSATDSKESLYEFKKQNSELNYIFDLPEIKRITNTLPVLSAHMTATESEQAYQRVISQLTNVLKNNFTDTMWNVWFSRLSYLVSTIILDIPQRRDDHVKLLPYVLGDKLNLHGHSLVDNIVATMTLTVIEDFENRARLAKQQVQEWIVETKLNRVIIKLLPEHADLYNKVIAHYLTEEIVSQLDILIKKEIDEVS